MPFLGDMLVPWSVSVYLTSTTSHLSVEANLFSVAEICDAALGGTWITQVDQGDQGLEFFCGGIYDANQDGEGFFKQKINK